MRNHEKLERRYRRWLTLYPRRFRRESGEELISVLMAAARHDDQHGGLFSFGNLARNALRARLAPRAPRPARAVRAAVALMYAGAAVTALALVASVVATILLGVPAATLRVGGEAQPAPLAVAVGFVAGGTMTALWIVLARENGSGRRWARALSTGLFVLATLRLFGEHGAGSVAFALATWGLATAVVWLLWLPSSNAFFHRRGEAETAG